MVVRNKSYIIDDEKNTVQQETENLGFAYHNKQTVFSYGYLLGFTYHKPASLRLLN
jgi:hypothetical protein